MRTLTIVVTMLLLQLFIYAQPPKLNTRIESAPCGGKGKIVFFGLVPELPYKVSVNNGKSFSRITPNPRGEITIENLPGRYDVIITNEYGRVKGEATIPTKGAVPKFKLSQSPSVCGNQGNIIVEGLKPTVSYRISTDNGESYKHFSVNDTGIVSIPIHAGDYDVLVANKCGFAKNEITVTKKGKAPKFKLSSKPSKCEQPGSIIISGLEAGASYEVSTNNGQKFSFFETTHA